MLTIKGLSNFVNLKHLTKPVHNVLRLLIIIIRDLIPWVMFGLCPNHTLGDIEKPCIRAIMPVILRAIMLHIY